MEQKLLDAQMWEALREPDIKKALKDLTRALNMGANPNAVYVDDFDNKWTSLTYITQTLHVSSPDFNYQEQMVALLVDRGANVNSRCSRNNMTPLMGAVENNAVNVVKLLLDKGANANDIWHYELVNRVFGKDISRGWDNRSALGFARTPEMLQILLEHGANPNKGADELGCYPLHMACEYLTVTRNSDKALQMLNLLLEYGANPNMPTLKLLTPMMIVCGAMLDKRITHQYEASSDDKLAAIKLLFEYGANIDADSYGRTALGFAAESEDWPVVEALAFNGASINRDVVPFMPKEKEKRVWDKLRQIMNKQLEWERQKEEKRKQEEGIWKSSAAQMMNDLKHGKTVLNTMNETAPGAIVKKSDGRSI